MCRLRMNLGVEYVWCMYEYGGKSTGAQALRQVLGLALEMLFDLEAVHSKYLCRKTVKGKSKRRGRSQDSGTAPVRISCACVWSSSPIQFGSSPRTVRVHSCTSQRSQGSYSLPLPIPFRARNEQSTTAFAADLPAAGAPP